MRGKVDHSNPLVVAARILLVVTMASLLISTISLAVLLKGAKSAHHSLFLELLEQGALLPKIYLEHTPSFSISLPLPTICFARDPPHCIIFMMFCGGIVRFRKENGPSISRGGCKQSKHSGP